MLTILGVGKPLIIAYYKIAVREVTVPAIIYQ